jgi:hypothetical protein
MLYVVGGGDGNFGQAGGPTESTAVVIAAPIAADGTLGTWQTLPSLPDAYVHSNPVVPAQHYAFVLGEFGTSTSAHMSTVLFADLAGDQQWKTSTAFSPAYGGYESTYGATSDGTYLVLVNSSGTVVQQSKLIASGGNEAWTAAPSLPMALQNTWATYAEGYVYVVGETNATPTKLVMVYAPLDASGVGTWIDPALSMTDTAYVQATVWQQHVYVAGGYNSGNAVTTDVWISDIDASGAPGTFSLAPPLPQPPGVACVTSSSNAVYVIGGDPGLGSAESYATIYYALPASDGAIGSWSTTTPLPMGRSGASCFVM